MSALLALTYALAVDITPPPSPSADLPMVEYHLGRDTTCFAHPSVAGLVCLTSS
jgi:hypothetical protein